MLLGITSSESRATKDEIKQLRTHQHDAGLSHGDAGNLSTVVRGMRCLRCIAATVSKTRDCIQRQLQMYLQSFTSLFMKVLPWP